MKDWVLQSLCVTVLDFHISNQNLGVRTSANIGFRGNTPLGPPVKGTVCHNAVFKAMDHCDLVGYVSAEVVEDCYGLVPSP